MSIFHCKISHVLFEVLVIHWIPCVAEDVTANVEEAVLVSALLYVYTVKKPLLIIISLSLVIHSDTSKTDIYIL